MMSNGHTNAAIDITRGRYGGSSLGLTVETETVVADGRAVDDESGRGKNGAHYTSTTHSSLVVHGGKRKGGIGIRDCGGRWKVETMLFLFCINAIKG